MEHPQFDILMVGHFAKDRIIVDGVSETLSGGAVYFGSSAIRHLGKRVAIATRLHPDDYFRLEELKQLGIGIFAVQAAETSGIANYYQSANMERRICKPLGFAGPFHLEEIPDLPVKVIMIAPIMAGEVDLPLLRQLAQRAPLALDIQGFIRVRVGDDLVFRPWEDMAEGLRHVTYLKVDRAEAEALTGETDLRRAALKLAQYGPKEIILSQSSGVTVLAGGEFYEAPFTPKSLAGRTGRGDTCICTYVAMRLENSAAEACRWAGAVTTLKQEKPGPWKGTPADVKAVFRSWDRL